MPGAAESHDGQDGSSPAANAQTANETATDDLLAATSIHRETAPGGSDSREAEQARTGPKHEQERHHGLAEKSQERWAWRRRIRADPRKRRFYRVGVGAAGAVLIILGGITGPLPGPGGIPLVLLGLAVWASEFAWAHRLMHWFKLQLVRFRGWNRRQKTVGWLIFLVALGVVGYGYLLLIGVPAWFPAALDHPLGMLPGVA